MPPRGHLAILGDIFDSPGLVCDPTGHWLAPRSQKILWSKMLTVLPLGNPDLKVPRSAWGFQSEASEGGLEIPAQLP